MCLLIKIQLEKSQFLWIFKSKEMKNISFQPQQPVLIQNILPIKDPVIIA